MKYVSFLTYDGDLHSLGVLEWKVENSALGFEPPDKYRMMEHQAEEEFQKCLEHHGYHAASDDLSLTQIVMAHGKRVVVVTQYERRAEDRSLVVQ